MRKIVLLIVGSLTTLLASAQFTYKVKADSVKITNDACSAELILENSTKNINGFLFNRANGRTDFRPAVIKMNNTFYHLGIDTPDIATNTAWKLTGNTGINPSTNFLGTTDAQPLIIKTNNVQQMKINTAGEVQVNSNTDVGDYKLQVTGNTYSSGVIQTSNPATFYQNVRIGDTTGVTNTTGSIYVTGNLTVSPVIRIDNVTYGANHGIIDITSNSQYNYSFGAAGAGAGLRVIKTAQNGVALTNYGAVYVDHQVQSNTHADVLYTMVAKTRVGASNGYAYFADAAPLSGAAGTAYAFYADSGPSYFKDRLSLDGPNGYSQLKLVKTYTPSSTSDTNGQTGDVAWDSNYIYIKTSSGWKRTALSTF